MPSRAVAVRFFLIVFLALCVCFVFRLLFLDPTQQALGAPDAILAIAVATAVTGGWLTRAR